jgi:hypothetical protein
MLLKSRIGRDQMAPAQSLKSHLSAIAATYIIYLAGMSVAN